MDKELRNVQMALASEAIISNHPTQVREGSKQQ